jgi:hypothetical protein
MAKRRYHWVYAVLLDPDCCATKKIRSRNPKARPSSPCIYVGFTTKAPPEPQFAKGDFSLVAKRYRAAAHSYLAVQGRKRNLEGALRLQQRLIQQFRDQGKAVVNGPPRDGYAVYVLRLDPPPRNTPKGRTAIYVGQTSWTPEERLLQHKQGLNTTIETHAERAMLLYDLFPDDPPGSMTRLESLTRERQLAEQLRRQGYHVLGGH